MQTVTRVLIGIQARSTSKRFPKKAHAPIGPRSMTDHVIWNVLDAIEFMRKGARDQIEFNTVLLVPEGDELKKTTREITVIEGDENDVLSRYKKAFAIYRPDYVCRVTADCPLLPEYVVSKHIRSAIFGPFDYVTNSDPRFTTCVDGHDCEVMSKRMMRWLFENANTPREVEHVTILCKERPPEWARICNIIGYLDMSGTKLSVDTKEDLEKVIKEYEAVERKLSAAKSYRERSFVFRL